MPQDLAIHVKKVVKKFGERAVLDGIDLVVHSGEAVCILGGSGSGKSTLLRVMTGALRTDGGDVVIGGTSICAMSDAELNEYRKRGIGVLFQSGALFNSMSVYDNVALPLREHTDLDESTVDIIVKMKLEQVGLREHADKMPAELSGGMKKRAGLARAMAMDPKVLFCDEPSAGLDPVTSAEVDELIVDLNKKLGITVVVITHEMDSARRIADRMVLLDRGRFVAGGTVEEMFSSTDPLVNQFMHGTTSGPLSERRKRSDYTSDLLSEPKKE